VQRPAHTGEGHPPRITELQGDGAPRGVSRAGVAGPDPIVVQLRACQATGTHDGATRWRGAIEQGRLEILAASEHERDQRADRQQRRLDILVSPDDGREQARD
jgi:hypothetical protein